MRTLQNSNTLLGSINFSWLPRDLWEHKLDCLGQVSSKLEPLFSLRYFVWLFTGILMKIKRGFKTDKVHFSFCAWTMALAVLTMSTSSFLWRDRSSCERLTTICTQLVHTSGVRLWQNCLWVFSFQSYKVLSFTLLLASIQRFGKSSQHSFWPQLWSITLLLASDTWLELVLPTSKCKWWWLQYSSFLLCCLQGSSLTRITFLSSFGL